jgi:hypothetical protein
MSGAQISPARSTFMSKPLDLAYSHTSGPPNARLDPERWQIEDHLCEMVQVAQAAFERAKIENASVAERHLVACTLETSVKRLVGFVLDDICPTDLKDKFQILTREL